jgi:signal transduction histidine kinase
MKRFKEVLGFIKTYPGIFYSLFLIIFFPLFLYFVVFYFTSKFQENVDLILQTETFFLSHSFGLMIKDYFSEPEILQNKISELIKEHPKIKQIRVLKKEDDNFKIISSNKKNEVGAILQDPSILLSWNQEQPIVTLFSDAITKERFWKASTIVFDGSGKKMGLVSLALSLKETDEMISDLIFKSFIVILVGIFLFLLLIVEHTTLFGYVELSRKLKEIDKAKDEFIRLATHELQGPIVNIKNYIWALKEELKDKISVQYLEYLERAENSAKNLILLVEDLLEVSRIEQGRVDFTPKVFSPQKEIEQVISDFWGKAKEKKLYLVFEKSNVPVLLNINPLRFREIVSNLISNAIKYTFEGGVKVMEKIDFEKKRYYIFVKDTGVGISAEAQQKIFQKFFRERKKETADIEGTGLGLYISKELAKRMGGDILVESIEGQGSIFIVYFPIFSK